VPGGALRSFLETFSHQVNLSFQLSAIDSYHTRSGAMSDRVLVNPKPCAARSSRESTRLWRGKD
jgi:hypothetical protein